MIGPTTAAARERLGVDEALATVLARVCTLDNERVALADALGRVLGADVRAGWDVPPWPNAAMDGYAVRTIDVAAATEGAPITLRIVGEVPAGARWHGTLGTRECVRIATGAPVPAGADAVVRVEDTVPAAVDAVSVRDGRDARQQDTAGGVARRNIRPAGEDLRADAVAAAAGTPVTPGVVGLLAAAGAAQVDVVRRPRVAIVASGDELVDLDDAGGERARTGAAIVNANAYALAALVRTTGGEAVDFGIAPDTPDGVRDRIAAARDAGCDVVLTTGGVSVGPRDLVRPAVDALGGTLAFWRVRMRPGGPLAFGALPPRGETAGGPAVPWFGLPGNPVSTAVTFALFVRPLLRAMAGDARPFRRTLRATLGEPLRTAAPLTHFLRATLATDDAGEIVARLTGPQGSGLLSSVAAADALVVVPASVRALPAGAPIRALPLGGDALAGDPFACAERPSYEGA
ncbi:MAG TPA: gephyrin-like molybdotransferase Glp [Gemmatirosa sp.]